MASNEITIRVRTEGGKTVLEAVDNTRKLKGAVDSVNESQRRGTKSAHAYHDAMNKGVIGTARNARDFSKLSQTIGSGNNGLVGAYATLAANTFAVVAAFSALQRATNAMKIMAGLEAQGARLGQTLSITAANMRELTGNAMAMADAMRSTAQLTAGGFDADQIEELTGVARDAAGALGRDLNDAMDRLSRGVTKLEPELLDELGIMTKLDEASALYAVQLNKSASSLTAAEKRQAFMNAVLEEGRRKFGGIGEQVAEYDTYTRLAAAATDLFNSSMGAVAATITPIVEIFAANKGLILGALVLYASTIRKDLIPALSDAAAAQQDLVQERGAGLAARAKDFAEQAAAVEDAQKKAGRTPGGGGYTFLPRAGAKELRSLAQVAEDGTVSLGDFRRAHKALTAQLENADDILRTTAENTEKYQIALANRDILEGAQREVRALTSAYYEQQAAQRGLTVLNTAQNAQMGNLRESFSTIGRELKEQFLDLQMASRPLDQATTRMGRAGQAIGTAASGAGNALAVAGTGARAFGVMALNALPMIGQITIAITLLTAAYSYLKDALTTEEQKLFNKTQDEFNAIVEESTKKMEAYNKLSYAAKESAKAQIDALKITGNGISEITEKYLELSQARRDARDSSIFDNKVDKVFGSQELGDLQAEGWAVWGTKNRAALDQYRQGIDTLGASMSLMNETQRRSTMQQVRTIHAIEDYNERVEAQEKLIQKINEQYKHLTLAAENVQETFKNLEDATTGFINSANISTPVDKLAETLNKAATASAELNLELMRNSASITQIGRAMAGTLGAQSRNLLGADIAQIQRFEEVQREIKHIRDQGAEGDQARLSRALVDEERLAANMVTLIQQRLNDTRELVRQNQIQYRTAKDNLALEEARYNRAKDLFEVGAQGYLAREEHEEKVRTAQVNQLDMQQTLLKIMQTQAQRAILALKERRAELAIQLDQLKVLKEQVEQEKLGYRLRTGIAEAKESEAASRSKTLEEQRRINLELTQLDISIRAADDGMNELRDSIKSLDTQKATILAQNLTEAEKAARAMGAEFEVSKKFYKQVQEYADAIYGTNKAIRDFNMLVSGSNNEIQKQLLGIIETYEETRLSLARQLAERAGQLNVDVSILETNKEAVSLTEQGRKAAQESLDVARAEYQNQYEITQQLMKQAEVQMNLQAVELAIYDTRKEGVEWQKQAFDLSAKEAELAANNLKTNREIAAVRRQQARRQRGLGDSEQNTRNESLREASDVLMAAKTAAKYRIESINAEYALLEAQRIMLEQELVSRRHILSLQEGVSEAYLAPLNNAIQILQGIDTGSMRDQAIRGVVLDIEKKTEDVRMAQLDAVFKRTLGEDSYLARAVTRREDNRQRDAALEESNRALSAPIQQAAQLIVTSNKTGIKEIPDAVGKSLSPILSPIDRVAEDVHAIRQHITGSGAPLTDITSLGRDAQSRGLRVSEAPGFGGVQAPHKGRGHAEGRAVDINFGTGNVEANIPSMKAEFDRLAKEYQSKGFVVLWNKQRYAPFGGITPLTGHPHTDHMHVESPGVRVDPRVSATAANVEARAGASGETNAQIGHFEDRILANMPNASEPLAKAAATMPNSGALVGTDAIVAIAERAAPNFNESMIKMAENAQYFREEFEFAMEPLYTLAQNLGPDGEMLLAITNGVTSVTTSLQDTFTVLSSNTIDSTNGITAMLGAAQTAVNMVSQITAAASAQKIRAIEAEIAAEQRRDGQSAASVAKLAELEKRKDTMARKQFQVNKKLMMATAVIATATGITQALTLPPPLSFIMAGIVGALGAAQLAIIAGTSYQGGNANTNAGKITPPKLTIGRVGDKVNLDRSNPNAGGEIGYLRGTAGYGTNASNYSTIGSAYGGRTNRGYGHRSFLVGEKGPETIETLEPMRVRPREEAPVKQGDQYIIQATDADSFVNMLQNNPEAIAKGLRRLANSNGTPFLEGVDLKTFRANKR